MPKKNRTNTLQEKFGFLDGDLKTPAHDAIMLWLDGAVEAIARDHVANKMKASSAHIEKLREEADGIVIKYFPNQTWDGLGEPPKPTFLGIIKKWESPITTSSKFIAGFVDMEVNVKYQHLDIYHSADWSRRELPKWQCYNSEATLLFEVKAKIQSVGEVIRQIRMYQEYKKGEYYIVSPDNRYEDVFQGQNIKFIKVPSSINLTE